MLIQKLKLIIYIFIVFTGYLSQETGRTKLLASFGKISPSFGLEIQRESRHMRFSKKDFEQTFLPAINILRSLTFWHFLWIFYFCLLILYVILRTQERKQKIKFEREKIRHQLIADEQLKIYKNLSIKISHEIRNYLNVISMSNENCQQELQDLEKFLGENSFLFEESLDDSEKTYEDIINYFRSKFWQIENSVAKISLIIENIVTENLDDQQSSQALIDVNVFIKNIIEESNWQKNQLFKPQEIKIELKCTLDLPPILINPVDLEGVIVNLLANAYDSLSEKKAKNLHFCPKIVISTLKTASGVEIKIKDNGVGISTDNLKYIFNPFWSSKNTLEGIGVGLFFSQQRIKKHGGTISVDSVEGEWAEFTVSCRFAEEIDFAN